MNARAWSVARLGDVCDLNPPRPELRRLDAEPTSFVPMAAVAESGKGMVLVEERPFAEVRKGYTYFEEGDVLFAKITPCMQNGKHAIAAGLRGGIGFASTEFHVLRPKREAVVAEWVHFFLLQPDVLLGAEASCSGAVGQQRVPPSYLAELRIPLPSIAEQRRIAARLTEQLAAVERTRKAALERLATTRRLGSAEFKRAFLGITPLAADRVRDNPPPGWRWRKLTEVARLESGHTPSRYHPEWWGGPVPWIALPDIRALDGKVAYDTIEHTNDAGIANSSARILPADTVVLSRTASVGFVTVMGREMATSQDFVNWVCGPNLDSSFLALVLRASRDYIRSLSSGAIHKTVYVPTVKRFEVCAPAIDEQRRVAARLSWILESAAEVAAAAESELAAIEALPSALLRETFS